MGQKIQFEKLKLPMSISSTSFIVTSLGKVWCNGNVVQVSIDTFPYFLISADAIFSKV